MMPNNKGIPHVYHGHRNEKIYRVWAAMKDRCNNPNNPYFYIYGGKGITYDKECQTFLPFYEWAIKAGYREGLTLDRKDGNGNYCPENCEWTTMLIQSNHTSRNHFIERDGVRQTVSQWMRQYGYSPNKFYHIKEKYECSDEEALNIIISMN